MAYDESTAWFRVQHCLKPLRPLAKKKSFIQFRAKKLLLSINNTLQIDI